MVACEAPYDLASLTPDISQSPLPWSLNSSPTGWLTDPWLHQPIFLHWKFPLLGILINHVFVASSLPFSKALFCCPISARLPWQCYLKLKSFISTPHHCTPFSSLPVFIDMLLIWLVYHPSPSTRIHERRVYVLFFTALWPRPTTIYETLSKYAEHFDGSMPGTECLGSAYWKNSSVASFWPVVLPFFYL